MTATRRRVGRVWTRDELLVVELSPFVGFSDCQQYRLILALVAFSTRRQRVHTCPRLARRTHALPATPTAASHVIIAWLSSHLTVLLKLRSAANSTARRLG